MNAEQAFDAAVRANPVAVGEYLGCVALKARELRAAGETLDAIDEAFNLVDTPLELPLEHAAPCQRERNVVAILMGVTS